MSDDMDVSDELEALNHEEAHEEAETDDEIRDDEGTSGGQDETGEGQNEESPRGREGLESPARTTGRANDSIRRLRERAQAAERKLIEEQARSRALAELRQPAQPQVDPAVLAQQQAEELARLEMMSPAQQAQYFSQRAAAQMQRSLADMQRQQAVQLDAVKFEALRARDPLAEKHAARVEAIVQEQLQKGIVVPREQALRYAIGDAVLASKGRAVKTAKTAAGAEVARQTVRRGGPAADTPAEARGRGNDLAALEKRLAGKNI